MSDGPDTAVVHRFKRAQGQLAGVVRMMEDGRDPQSVLHQLKAVTNALDRAGFALVAQEWRRADAAGEVDDVATFERIEELFLSFA